MVAPAASSPPASCSPSDCGSPGCCILSPFSKPAQRDGIDVQLSTTSDGSAQIRGASPVPSGNALKVLALGDSITYGCGNTCGQSCANPCCASSSRAVPGCETNGSCPFTPCPSCGGSYRAPLDALLKKKASNHSFEFVGSMEGGGTKHEGHPGWRIDQLLNISANWSAFAPDIILLHAGSNDVMQGPYAYAPFPDPNNRSWDQMLCHGFDPTRQSGRSISLARGRGMKLLTSG